MPDVEMEVARDLEAWALTRTANAMNGLCRRYAALAKDSEESARSAAIGGYHRAEHEHRCEAAAYRQAASMAGAEEAALLRRARDL